MALIKCHECGQRVSTEAETCPHCGAKPKAKTSTAPLDGILNKIVVGAILLGLSIWGFNYLSTPKPSKPEPYSPVSTNAAPEAPPAPVVMPSQKEMAEAIEKREAAGRESAHQFAMVVMYLRSLKESMREPSSFDPEIVLANSDASLICVQYRGKNGMGGYNRELAIYKGGKTNRSPDAWQQLCTGKLEDLIYARRAM